MFRQQAHDGERGHALAAAGFADQPQGRALGDAEVDAVDGVGGAAVVAMKDDLQAFDIDQRGIRHFCPTMAAAMPVPMVSRSVFPAGLLRLASMVFICTQAARPPMW